MSLASICSGEVQYRGVWSSVDIISNLVVSLAVLMHGLYSLVTCEELMNHFSFL